jgi:hypothetical protein
LVSLRSGDDEKKVNQSIDRRNEVSKVRLPVALEGESPKALESERDRLNGRKAERVAEANG